MKLGLNLCQKKTRKCRSVEFGFIFREKFTMAGLGLLILVHIQMPEKKTFPGNSLYSTWNKKNGS